jgi:MYXO-CTERM domain-containing protein
MTRIQNATFSMLVTASLVALGAGVARADTVVQIPLPGLLDTRSVFTLTNGVIVPFTLAIDGGNGDVGTGAQNGFATKAVAMMKSPNNVANALPDDGFFPADVNHPDLFLNFSNAAAATSPQNHLVKPMVGTTPPETFSFPVPAATYSKLFLFFHGANNGTTVKITLTYADATTDVTMATILDFGNGSVPPANGNVFVLVGNLAKWTKTTGIAEGGNHNIFGVTVLPMAKTLTMVKVERGPTGYLVFWGATGVATSAVAGLPDGGGSAGSSGGGDASTTDASGGAGTTATGDAGGAAGAAGGAAGATGGGAGTQTTGAAGATAGAGGTSAAGTGGAAGATTSSGAAGAPAMHSSSSGGCGCVVGDATSRAPWLVLGAALAWSLGRRRRRGARRR